VGNKRHCRTLPDGRLAVTQLVCEDNAEDEIALCEKTRFELGRIALAAPRSESGRAAVLLLGENWRNLVHFSDWSTWGEPMPLEACHCVDVSELPLERDKRNKWILKDHRVIIGT